MDFISAISKSRRIKRASSRYWCFIDSGLIKEAQGSSYYIKKLEKEDYLAKDWEIYDRENEFLDNEETPPIPTEISDEPQNQNQFDF